MNATQIELLTALLYVARKAQKHCAHNVNDIIRSAIQVTLDVAPTSDKRFDLSNMEKT